MSALDLWPKGGFAGIGPEINGYARTGYSAGGGLLLGFDLNESFSTGLKAGFFDNFDTISAFETMLFFRYCLPFLRFPKKTDGPFAQLEAGSVILFESGYHENLEAFPSFSGGLAVGWRFNFGEHGYVEASARAGYPHIWGASITAGIRFRNRGADGQKEETSRVVVVKNKNNEDDGDIKVERGKDGKLRLQVYPIVFPANRADFSGLSGDAVQVNNATIKRVAEFLNKNEKYKIVIEGHANPTTPEGRARERERYTLVHLSEKRAVKVLEELGKHGVSYSRMTVLEEGFSGMAAPYNDKRNNWKNRRVEFILITE